MLLFPAGLFSKQACLFAWKRGNEARCAIAGGAETFFGKNKSRGLDGKLQKITKIAAVVFIVLAIVTTIIVAHNASSSAAVTDVDAAVQEILDAEDAAAADVADVADAVAEGETEAAAEGETEAEADTAAN